MSKGICQCFNLKVRPFPLLHKISGTIEEGNLLVTQDTTSLYVSVFEQWHCDNLCIIIKYDTGSLIAWLHLSVITI